MPDLPQAEENIESLLAHFQQQGRSNNIRAWRQEIEDREAQTACRPPHAIDTKQAVDDFRHALLTNTSYSPSAKSLKTLFQERTLPTEPKFTYVDTCRLQNPANRPAFLTPDQQIYVDRYDKQQLERARWDVPNSADRLNKWDKLEELGRNDEVWADQARMLEEHLDQHLELTNELVKRFVIPGPPPGESRYPESIHWSGLYWIAANVVFRRFGMSAQIEQQIGHAVFDRLYWFLQGNPQTQPFHTLREDRRESLNAACGEAMVACHRKLAKRGASAIQFLERWLVHSAKKILVGGRAVDPETRKRQRRQRNNPQDIPEDGMPNLTDNEKEDSLEYSSNELVLDHDDDFLSLASSLVKSSEDESEEEPSPPTLWQSTEVDLLFKVQVAECIRSLPEHVRMVVLARWTDPLLTEQDLADHFNCDERTIRNYFHVARERLHDHY